MFIALTLLGYTAPLGAACKVNIQKHIARSAGARDFLGMRGYKHRAPSEHLVAEYRGKTNFCAKPQRHFSKALCHQQFGNDFQLNEGCASQINIRTTALVYFGNLVP